MNIKSNVSRIILTLSAVLSFGVMAQTSTSSLVAKRNGLDVKATLEMNGRETIVQGTITVENSAPQKFEIPVKGFFSPSGEQEIQTDQALKITLSKFAGTVIFTVVDRSSEKERRIGIVEIPYRKDYPAYKELNYSIK